MTKRIRVGVVGVGYFGRFHARQYAQNPQSELVAVVDVVEAAARETANAYGCAALTDHRQLIGHVDAASVAVSTPHHFDIAHDLMTAGIDVLVEKPMTHDVTSAIALSDLARRHGKILQVGHIERYSSSFQALSAVVDHPQYIESNRISPWRERGTEIDVVFDLMIHDIDIILGLVRSPVRSVHAVGTPVFGEKVDLANARIGFASGCVANVTASRVSHKTERNLRIFQPSAYLVCDFIQHRIYSHTLKGDPATLGATAIAADTIEVPKQDSLANEIRSFLKCVADRGQPAVDAKAGIEAMRLAERINASIEKYRGTIALAQRA